MNKIIIFTAILLIFLLFGCTQLTPTNTPVEIKTFMTECVQGEHNTNWTFENVSDQKYTFAKNSSKLTLICSNLPLDKLQRTTKDWNAYEDVYLDELKLNLVESGFVNPEVELLNKSNFNNGGEEGLKLKILLTLDGKSAILYSYFNSKIDSINNKQMVFHISYTVGESTPIFVESEVDTFVSSLKFVS